VKTHSQFKDEFFKKHPEQKELYEKDRVNDERVKKIGAYLMEVRKKEGHTQTRLAELVGMTQQQLSDIENGRNFTVRTLLDVADALNLDDVPMPHVIEQAKERPVISFKKKSGAN